MSRRLIHHPGEEEDAAYLVDADHCRIFSVKPLAQWTTGFLPPWCLTKYTLEEKLDHLDGTIPGLLEYVDPHVYMDEWDGEVQDPYDGDTR